MSFDSAGFAGADDVERVGGAGCAGGATPVTGLMVDGGCSAADEGSAAG